MRVGATIPAIVQAPSSAKPSANHSRGDERSREQRAADDGEDRPDRADESGVADLGAGQRDVEDTQC